MDEEYEMKNANGSALFRCRIFNPVLYTTTQTRSNKPNVKIEGTSFDWTKQKPEKIRNTGLGALFLYVMYIVRKIPHGRLKFICILHFKLKH